MLLIRGIVLSLSGLLLAGCMQTGTLAPSSDANFTARDRQQLANPPYQRGVDFTAPISARSFNTTGKKPPGSIVVDTAGPFVYYVLPGGKAIRYGATVGEAWTGLVRRGHCWP